MKKILIITALILLFHTGIPAKNPSDQTSIILHKKLYKKAVTGLQRGNAEQKVKGALFLGARRNPRYARLLGTELLRDLDVKNPNLQFVRNDPYVKSHIAWALGKVRHKVALRYLLIAMEKTALIIVEEDKRLTQKEKASTAKFIQDRKNAQDPKRSATEKVIEPVKDIVLNPRVPGPYLAKKKSGIPYSPDMYWSISNEFKRFMAPDRSEITQRVHYKGYNYINLLHHIFDSIGEIYHYEYKKGVDLRHVNALAKYLEHPFTYIRGAAAVALGRIHSKTAIDKLDAHYKKEKSPEVRVKISHAILIYDKTRTDHFQNILDMLESPDKAVRYVSAVALRDLGIPESAESMKEALRLEHVELIRLNLKQGIYKAHVNSLIPN